MRLLKRQISTFDKSSSGFTLIELLVSIFIFSIIVVIIGSIFIQTLNLQRRALLIQQAEEDLVFVLEAMAREIRVSKICPQTGQCASSSVLDIDHPVNGQIQYNLAGGVIHRVDDGVDTILSSSAVKFAKLEFRVSGTANNDDKQPRVTIIVFANASNTTLQSEIKAQTTVSQRFLSDQYKQ